MITKNKEIHSSYKEAVENLYIDIRLTRIMLVVFGVIAIIARALLRVPVSLYIFAVLFLWFLSYLTYPRLIKRKKTASELYDLYFKYIALDLVFLTVIIHYLGAAEWIGVIFYLLTITLAGTVLPKKKSLLLSIIAGFLYSTLVLLEYFEILLHNPLFSLGAGLYKDSAYVFSQLFVIGAFFLFIGETAGTFSERLKEKQGQLEKAQRRIIKAYKQTEEARRVLEVKVRARTEELERLTEEQEKIIEERTKELQGKIKELEKFQKIAVGRELKMIELKKEIKSLQEDTRKQK